MGAPIARRIKDVIGRAAGKVAIGGRLHWRKDMGGTLSITPDSGYGDNFEVAAPILRKLGLPLAFFVITGFIGTQTVALWDQWLPQAPGWMDLDQVRSLASPGFESGCHTDTHIDRDTADEQTAWANWRCRSESCTRSCQDS